MEIKAIKLANEIASVMIKHIEKDFGGIKRFIDAVDDIKEFNKCIEGFFGIKLAMLMSKDEELRKEIEKNEEGNTALELLKIFSDGNI